MSIFSFGTIYYFNRKTKNVTKNNRHRSWYILRNKYWEPYENTHLVDRYYDHHLKTNHSLYKFQGITLSFGNRVWKYWIQENNEWCKLKYIEI